MRSVCTLLDLSLGILHHVSVCTDIDTNYRKGNRGNIKAKKIIRSVCAYHTQLGLGLDILYHVLVSAKAQITMI